MELEQEVLHLRDQCRSFGALVQGLREQLLVLFGPEPRPRPEILVALRLLATCEGLPDRCGDRDCRRAGMCQAGDIGKHACADLWTSELFDRLDLMATGIKLSALAEEQRDAAIYAHLAPTPEAPAPKAATGSRKKRRQPPKDGL